MGGRLCLKTGLCLAFGVNSAFREMYKSKDDEGADEAPTVCYFEAPNFVDVELTKDCHRGQCHR